jgi:hypothetical protein
VTCEEIKETTVPYLELDLEARRVKEITAHLEACGNCRSEMEAVRQVLVRLKGRAVPDPGERFWSGFPGKVREEFRAATAQHKAWEGTTGNVFQRLRKRVSDGFRDGIQSGSRGWGLALAASVMILLGSWVLVVRQQPQTPAGSTGQTPVKTPPGDIADLSDMDGEGNWDDEDPDTLLVELAARLDQPTLDRLFNDI